MRNARIVGKTKHRIAVLVAYFGRWPDYLRLFLESCRHNPSIDFLLIGDCGPLPSDASPPNCRLHSMTLAEFNRLASAQLGFSVTVCRPYKLCDLKPLYGRIFSKLLGDYDFWGWCDLDLAFGNIRKFAGDEVLSSCDVFSCNRWYVSGPFTLVRRDGPFESLVMASPDVRNVIEDADRDYGFDECAGCWNALARGKSILDIDTPVQSLTEILVRAENDGEVRWRRDSTLAEKVTGAVTVDHGHIWMDGREYLAFHFVCVKAGLLFTFSAWEAVPDTYHVNRIGFFRPGEKTGLAALLVQPRRGRTCRRLANRLLHKSGKALGMLARGNLRGIGAHIVRRHLERQGT